MARSGNSLEVLRDVAREAGVDPDEAERVARAAAGPDGDLEMECDLLASDLLGGLGLPGTSAS